jgi:hypothetical protein
MTARFIKTKKNKSLNCTKEQIIFHPARKNNHFKCVVVTLATISSSLARNKNEAFKKNEIHQT